MWFRTEKTNRSSGYHMIIITMSTKKKKKIMCFCLYISFSCVVSTFCKSGRFLLFVRLFAVLYLFVVLVWSFACVLRCCCCFWGEEEEGAFNNLILHYIRGLFSFFFLDVDSGNVVLVNCDDDVINAVANGHNGHDDDVFVIVSDITLFAFLLSINIRYSAFSASSPPHPSSSFPHHVCY